MKPEDRRDLTSEEACDVVDLWRGEGLKNIRFSGGEPTLWPDLDKLVHYTKVWGVEHIAISTNGSASLLNYLNLIRAGVNDISISLDACCSSTGETMAGKKDVYDHVLANIEALAPLVYVTIGVVLTDQNYHEVNKIVNLAKQFRVGDIRLISAAQQDNIITLPKHHEGRPILTYRCRNATLARGCRGLRPNDAHRCYLALDDMAVMNGKHYPCIIYMREHGKPVGPLDNTVRTQRLKWVQTHNSWLDPICKANCLDVCIDYNNKWRELHGHTSTSPSR
jgi:MoaA/NifB/PqqE/SkfB family radical SAM enzyme